jgi:hypothetical protein
MGMARIFPLLLAAALLAGCQAYSLDMTGMNRWSSDQFDDTADRLSVLRLESRVSTAMSPYGEPYSIMRLEAYSSRTLGETADHYSILRLERNVNQTLDPIADRFSVMRLEKATSKALDPDTIHRR